MNWKSDQYFFESGLNDYYSKSYGDYRKEERVFPLLESSYIKNKFVVDLISKSASMAIINNKNNINELDISLHQVRQICYPNILSHNSPEGIHRDGADYIISALVMNRKNIEGGESIIYNEKKKFCFNK